MSNHDIDSERDAHRQELTALSRDIDRLTLTVVILAVTGIVAGIIDAVAR